MLWLSTDASVDDQRRLTGLGFYLTDDQHQLQLAQHLAVPYCDNHQAEFAAARWGLAKTAEQVDLAAVTLVLQTDSQLLADSINKRYAKHYDQELRPILALTDQCALFFVKQIGDHQNKAAHRQARLAIYG